MLQLLFILLRGMGLAFWHTIQSETPQVQYTLNLFNDASDITTIGDVDARAVTNSVPGATLPFPAYPNTTPNVIEQPEGATRAFQVRSHLAVNAGVQFQYDNAGTWSTFAEILVPPTGEWSLEWAAPDNVSDIRLMITHTEDPAPAGLPLTLPFTV